MASANIHASLPSEPLTQNKQQAQYMGEKWVISQDDIQTVGKSLGIGMLGDTKQCTYGNKMTAATIKYLRPYRTSQEFITDFADDIRMCYELPPHERVVPVLGGVTEGGCAYLCPEYANATDLGTFIKELHGTTDIESRMEIAIQVAEGLEFLHEHNVMHGLLKPSDVLLNAVGPDGKYEVLIKDYGFTRTRWYNYKDRSRKSNEYIAPELVKGNFAPQAYTERADIFGFGCLLWQLFEGADMEIFCRINLYSGDEIKEMKFMNINNCQHIQKLILCCCNVNPAKRPNLSLVMRILRQLKAQPNCGFNVPSPTKANTPPVAQNEAAPNGEPNQTQGCSGGGSSGGAPKPINKASTLMVIKKVLRDEWSKEDRVLKCLTIIEKYMDVLDFDKEMGEYLVSNIVTNSRYSNVKTNERATDATTKIMEKGDEAFIAGVYDAVTEKMKVIMGLTFQFHERLYLPRFVHYLAKKSRMGQGLRDTLHKCGALRVFLQSLSRYADGLAPTPQRSRNWLEMATMPSPTVTRCSPVDAATCYLMCLSQVVGIDNKNPDLDDLPSVCERVLQNFGCKTREEEVLRYYLVKVIGKMRMKKDSYENFTSDSSLRRFLNVEYTNKDLGRKTTALVYKIIREHISEFCNGPLMSFLLRKFLNTKDIEAETELLSTLNIEGVVKVKTFGDNVKWLSGSQNILGITLAKMFESMDSGNEERFDALATFATNIAGYAVGNNEQARANAELLLSKVSTVHDVCGETPVWERLMGVLLGIVQAKESPSADDVLGATCKTDFICKLSIKWRLTAIKAYVAGLTQNEKYVKPATKESNVNVLLDSGLVTELVSVANDEGSEHSEEAMETLVSVFRFNGAVRAYKEIDGALDTILRILNITADSRPEVVECFVQGICSHFKQELEEVTKTFKKTCVRISATREVTGWEFVFLCSFKIFTRYAGDERYSRVKAALAELMEEITKQLTKDNKYNGMFIELMARFKIKNALEKVVEEDWNTRTKILAMKAMSDVGKYVN